MKTYRALVAESLRSLGIPVDTFSEPELRDMLPEILTAENSIIHEVKPLRRELLLDCVAAQRDYEIPDEIYAITQLYINGYTITDRRVGPDKINVRS